MYPTSNSLDPWWPLASVTSPGERLLRLLSFGIWKRSGEAIYLYCHQNLAIQNHMCDSALIWMWLLGTVCQHREPEKCIHHITLQDHAKHQVSWLYKQFKNSRDDKHPAPYRHCKTEPSAFLRAHPQDARWWTMQKIMSSCFNSWQKETRVTKDKLHILHPEAAWG